MPDCSIHPKKTSTLRIQTEKNYAGEIDHDNSGWFARRMGAHTDGTLAAFFTWHPEIENAPETAVQLELFIPRNEIRYETKEQEIRCKRITFPMETVGPFALCVVEGLPSGDRDRFGAFYQFILEQPGETMRVIRDPMAWSLPYGIYAPAELYNIKRVLAERRDADYFQNLDLQETGNSDNRIAPSVNLLEIHPGTATRKGTLWALDETFRQIGRKIRDDESLTIYEKNLTGFDAVELMPLDPVIEHPDNHLFWEENGVLDGQGQAQEQEVNIRLQKPAVTNWGYDVVIFGAAAVNPSLLATGRPHELLDLIETLHNFPGRPMKVILDVVYGHADNQALDLLPGEFFAGSGIYGQDIRFDHPMVRSIILEIQRRKMNWGFDGLRVDASQDIKRFDQKKEEVIYDDDYLEMMSNMKQEAAGITYKPWMIFEDGRPWPRHDWELAATYREITDRQVHPFQWAPTIFSYNTPYTYTYWVSKWWRIREILQFGDKWISGYANHDTMRRGTQADPASVNVNWLLGGSLKKVMQNAYNNPAATLVLNGFLPGVSLDFLQSLCNTPWTFIRNTDTTYAVKVAAEEAYFTHWQISEEEFSDSAYFSELKAMGFRSLLELRRFAVFLLKMVESLDYNPAGFAGLLNRVDPPFEIGGWTENKLNEFASAWFADLHLFCNADIRTDLYDREKSEFNLQVRNFRLEHSWLRGSLSNPEFFSYREPVEGSVIVYGYRISPADDTELILVANMEGQPSTVDPDQLKLPVDPAKAWAPALTTPGLEIETIDKPFKLEISQGVIFKSQT